MPVLATTTSKAAAGIMVRHLVQTEVATRRGGTLERIDNYPHPISTQHVPVRAGGTATHETAKGNCHSTMTLREVRSNCRALNSHELWRPGARRVSTRAHPRGRGRATDRTRGAYTISPGHRTKARNQLVGEHQQRHPGVQHLLVP